MIFKFGNANSLNDLKQAPISIDVETFGLNVSDKAYSFGVCNHSGGIVVILDSEDEFTRVSNYLSETLFNTSFKEIILFHNALFDFPFLLRVFNRRGGMLRSFDFAPNIICTLTLARYNFSTLYLDHCDLQKRFPFSLKYLSEYFDIDSDQASFDDIMGGRLINHVDPAAVAAYNFTDCENTLKLFDELMSELEQDGTKDYFIKYHMDHALWNMLHMKFHGCPFDYQKLLEWEKYFADLYEVVLDKIFTLSGKIFSFSSSQELSKAIFYNPRLEAVLGRKLAPPSITNNGRVKTDISTFKIMRDKGDETGIFNLIIFIMEITVAIKNLKDFKKFGFNEGDGDWYLYPVQKVAAKTGRSKCSAPNIHGLAKSVFKSTDFKMLESFDLRKGIEKFSSRALISNEKLYSVYSADAKSLDLKVLANLSNCESWLKIFENDVDNHFEILRVGNPDLFQEAFSAWGGRNIATIIEIPKINEEENSLLQLEPPKGIKDAAAQDIPEVSNEKEMPSKLKLKTSEGEYVITADEAKKLHRRRGVAKETNLGIPYLLGSANLAIKIADATGELMLASETKKILNEYYINFPEIRIHQDWLCNELYTKGFVRPSVNNEYFGMSLRSNTWFKLNKARLNNNLGYEFVVFIEGHHFYVKVDSWEPFISGVHFENGDHFVISKDLKTIPKLFGLYFTSLVSLRRLPDDIFVQKLEVLSKVRTKKKDEEDLEDNSNYIHDAIERSSMIDDYLKRNEVSIAFSAQEEIALRVLLQYGKIFIAEKNIKFYRTSLGVKQKYFNNYFSLIKESKKMFPAYIQSAAAFCVARVLSAIRKDFENENLQSYIFMSVHDSIDVMALDTEIDKVKEIFKSRLHDSFIPLTWKEELSKYYS